MMDAYEKLDSRIQKWIFRQGWPDLREIQLRAIQPILSRDRDVLISASTASGKTEAFFLPACSAVVEQDDGFAIVYVSPLKALINDQHRRLEDLCEALDIQVTPWHGDSSQSKKKKAKQNPSGILLITPESLESLLVREPGWLRQSFAGLQYICVDEFHAFIGTERGQQLISILTRVEHLLQRIDDPIPRVALSATLGDLERVPFSLRPNRSLPCETITSSEFHGILKVQVKGYIETADITRDENCFPAEYQVCQEIFAQCRGSSHLVFANSRRRTESIAAQLADFSEQNVVPNEFFPHHGSLAKELREELELRLQKESVPTTAICTMTLELGIDIGKVNSVIQVTAPHSVSSLRQRLGRSGRRHSPSILRMLISENELTERSSIIDQLRLELVQSLAMIRLLIMRHWFEPADTRQMHLSTLLHQMLAVIAQWGGIRVEQLYSLLCDHGPFKEIAVRHFKQLLTHMGTTRLIQQLGTGELVLGIEGERLVNSYTFYAVFKTPDEYRVVTGGKTLGTLPVDSLILKDQHIVFAGKRWKVTEVDGEKKVIHVVSTAGGKPPRFSGSGMSVHDVVRQEMLAIYLSQDYRIESQDRKIDFADDMARLLFTQGAEFFRQFGLTDQAIVRSGNDCYLFPWLGDKTVNTLTVMLAQRGFVANSFAGVIEIRNATQDDVAEQLVHVASGETPDETELASVLSEEQKHIEKYDDYISDPLLSEGYGRKAFDSFAARNWILTRLGE